MKYVLMSFLAAFTASFISSQTMTLVPLKVNSSMGLCQIPNSKKYSCYGLQYTPANSGVLTSYTTAFFVSCTSAGPAVARNQSCTMATNVSQHDGCESLGVSLVNCSGHSGTLQNNFVNAGVPVILHQVCFVIPAGQSITVREDTVTDLTTSLDILDVEIITEYPSFEEMVIRKEVPYISRPTWLDFKGVAAGDFISQLDWTTSMKAGDGDGYFIIERSGNGKDFEEIGRLESNNSGRMQNYQFLDKSAKLGKNYYRLLRISTEDNPEYSPVRIVVFSEKVLTVMVTPNPADDFILLEIESPDPDLTVRLVDQNGKAVIDEKVKGKVLQTRLSTGKFPAGPYKVVVETKNEKFSENLMIIH